MLRPTPGRFLPVLFVAACALVLVAPPSHAQTGMLKGKVVDGAGKPLDKIVVTIEFKDGINRKYEVKSNNKGEFIQIGLPPGNYQATATHKQLGTQSFSVRVRLGEAAEINFVLGGGEKGEGGMSKEEAAKAALLRQTFDAGVAASRASNFDEAIAKFNEAIGMVPNCFDCYYNIGYAETQKKAYEQAEAAFLKAIELKPDYVDAYNGLATVYNAQKKFDKAQEVSQKAVELASAASPDGTASVDSLYNQGVIAWNAGRIAEAKGHFLEVLKLKPDHADANYQVGMAYINEGKLAEAAAAFEKYLEIAPDGQYAAQVKAMLPQIKK
ncbi:MAG: tetratricopeptide repeat protein [Acidobacteriota bacterium]